MEGNNAARLPGEGSAPYPPYDKNGHRRSIFKKNLRSVRSILEIGALNRPLFRDDDRRKVQFADWLPTEELKRRHPGKTNVVHVDYVLTTPDVASHVDQRFDCIVACQVIEHIPDPVRWLRELAKLVNDPGYLFLVISDKRFTFNIVRQVATAADLLDCADRRLEAPSFGQLFGYYYYYRKIEAADVWLGRDLDLSRPRMSAHAAAQKAAAGSREQHAIHCHVFTSESFLEVFRDLQKAGAVDWKLVAHADPEPGSNEFIVVLKKVQTSPPK